MWTFISVDAMLSIKVRSYIELTDEFFVQLHIKHRLIILKAIYKYKMIQCLPSIQI